jgi:hypothetical protein
MADHPGVIFKDGPSGRPSALAYGPDVWEIIKFLREVDERGPAALDAAAEVFAVDASRISTAIRLAPQPRRPLTTRRGPDEVTNGAHRSGAAHKCDRERLAGTLWGSITRSRPDRSHRPDADLR